MKRVILATAVLFGLLALTAGPAAAAPVDFTDSQGTAISELTFGIGFEDISTNDEWDGGGGGGAGCDGPTDQKTC